MRKPKDYEILLGITSTIFLVNYSIFDLGTALLFVSPCLFIGLPVFGVYRFIKKTRRKLEEKKQAI